MTNPGTKSQDLWKPALIVLLVVGLYFFVLRKLVFDWWSDENYSHGLLVPFVIGFIIWNEFDEIRSKVGKPAFWIGGGMIVAAMGMLLAGTVGAELFIQRISFVLMTAGIVVYFWGMQLIKATMVLFTLFLFAIPIPQIIFNKIAFPLQIYASQLAIWGIRIFQVPSFRKGNVIEILPVGASQIVALEVVEACSGIRSLMTLATLALVFAYFTRTRPEAGALEVPFFKSFEFWRGLILVLSAIPIAIITNAGRVTATGIITYYHGKQAATGLAHDMLGWGVYLAALVLLLGVNYLLTVGYRIIGRRTQVEVV